MTMLLIFGTSLLFSLQTMGMKKLHSGSIAGQLGLNAAFMGLGAGMLALYGVFAQPAVFGLSLTTLLFGVLFGVLYASAVLCYLLALNRGPVALTAFYLSASMVIPAMVGVLFLHESLSVKRGAGLLVLLGAMYLTRQGEDGEGRSAGWVGLCLAAFILNGCTSVCQKLHQMISQCTQGYSLILIGYAAAALISGIAAAFLVKRPDTAARSGITRRNLPYLPVIAVCSVGGNLLLTYLAGQVDGLILYPLSQGGMLVMLLIISLAFLRERINRRSMLGLLLGILAIVLIG